MREKHYKIKRTSVILSSTGQAGKTRKVFFLKKLKKNFGKSLGDEVFLDNLRV